MKQLLSESSTSKGRMSWRLFNGLQLLTVRFHASLSHNTICACGLSLGNAHVHILGGFRDGGGGNLSTDTLNVLSSHVFWAPVWPVCTFLYRGAVAGVTQEEVLSAQRGVCLLFIFVLNPSSELRLPCCL